VWIDSEYKKQNALETTYTNQPERHQPRCGRSTTCESKKKRSSAPLGEIGWERRVFANEATSQTKHLLSPWRGPATVFPLLYSAAPFVTAARRRRRRRVCAQFGPPSWAACRD
jgi:hypothetical protein